MNIDALRDAHQRRPFIPFTLYLSDGRNLSIDHPELLFMPPANSRTAVVATKSGDIRLIDVLMVTEIHLHETPRKRRKAS